MHGSETHNNCSILFTSFRIVLVSMLQCFEGSQVTELAVDDKSLPDLCQLGLHEVLSSRTQTHSVMWAGCHVKPHEDGVLLLPSPHWALRQEDALVHMVRPLPIICITPRHFATLLHIIMSPTRPAVIQSGGGLVTTWQQRFSEEWGLTLPWRASRE